MDNKVKALYEAHVAYTIAELTGDRLSEVISEEVEFIWKKLDGVKVNEVLTKEEILDFQQRNFDHREEVATPVKEYIKKLRNDLLEHLEDSDAKLEDVVDEASYKEIVKEIAELKDIREKIIHQAVSNPLYGEVLGNILANGIKSFTSEEGLAGKIPGASSFFKMGGGLLSGLQDSVDKNVKKFVTENISKLTSQSEKYILNIIDERKIIEIGNTVWKKGNEKPIAYGIKKMDAEKFDDFEPVIEKMVNHFVKSEYAQNINEFFVDHFLKENGDKSLQQILVDIELTKEDVKRETVELCAKISQISLADGSLEARVRKHLEGFYGSELVGEIIG